MKKFIWKITKYFTLFIAFFIIASVGLILLYKYLNPPITPLMVIRYFEHDGSHKINQTWKDYGEISGHIKIAAIAAEDQKFPVHRGFDVESIEDAIRDKMEGKRLRGASTISQQVAKNLFLPPNRSWLRKGVESYFTVLIEMLWSKKRILEVYLNIIETGDGIYGVQEASQKYFGKPSKRLTRDEAALLASSFPNPRGYSVPKPSSYLLERKQWVLDQMVNLGGVRYLEQIE